MGSEMCIRDRAGGGREGRGQLFEAALHQVVVVGILGVDRDGGVFGSGERFKRCLLYTSDAADERSRVDLGGRRIIKKKKRVLGVGTGGDTERERG